MQVFLVVSTTQPTAVADAIQRLVDDKQMLVKDGVWLVAFDGTTQQLADKLGVRDGTNGAGFIAPIGNYSGRASPDLWEWLKINWPSEKSRDES